MIAIDRREFISKLATGVLGAIVNTGIVPALVTHSFGQIPRPWEWELETEYKMRVVTIGVGPLGTEMARMLNRNRPDIECHAIQFSPTAGTMDHLPSLLDAASDSDLLFILFSCDDVINFPLIQAIAQTGRDYNTLTVGVADWSHGSDPMLRHRVGPLESSFNTLIRVSAASFSGSAQFINKEKTRQSLHGLAMRHAVAIINDLILRHSLICIDFADVKHILSSNSRGWVGTGVASGPSRGPDAAHLVTKQLADQIESFEKTTGALVCIQGSSDLTMEDFEEASHIFHNIFPESADIIVGLVLDESFGQNIKVTAVAMA